MMSEAAELALAPGSPMAPADDTAARQRELPVFDPAEAERAVGFVRLVRLLVALPMTTLGLLALGAGLAVGQLWFASTAGIITALILYSLWDDTRLTKSIERMRRGDLPGAEHGFRRVALSSRRFGPQRQRAHAYLAAIAWRRCDHEAALRWTRSRLALLGRTGSGTGDEQWSTAITEVWLLALLGHGNEARDALAELEPAPPDGDARLVEITARLLVAFALGEADEVRPHLGEWKALCESNDRVGLASAALVWAQDACGDRDAATLWAQRTVARADLEHLRLHAPRLHRWLRGYVRTSPYPRG